MYSLLLSMSSSHRHYYLPPPPFGFVFGRNWPNSVFYFIWEDVYSLSSLTKLDNEKGFGQQILIVSSWYKGWEAFLVYIYM